MSNRDARRDPRVGDEFVIRRGLTQRWWRRIIDVHGGIGVRYETNMGKTDWMTMESWLVSVRNAEVIHVAD